MHFGQTRFEGSCGLGKRRRLPEDELRVVHDDEPKQHRAEAAVQAVHARNEHAQNAAQEQSKKPAQDVP